MSLLTGWTCDKRISIGQIVTVVTLGLMIIVSYANFVAEVSRYQERIHFYARDIEKNSKSVEYLTRSLRVEVNHISKNHEQFATKKELEREVRALNEKLDWVIDEMKQNWR